MFKVEYKKHFIEGYLKGTDVDCKLEFPSHDTALNFAQIVLEKEPRRDFESNDKYVTKEIKVIKV